MSLPLHQSAHSPGVSRVSASVGYRAFSRLATIGSDYGRDSSEVRANALPCKITPSRVNACPTILRSSTR